MKIFLFVLSCLLPIGHTYLCFFVFYEVTKAGKIWNRPWWCGATEVTLLVLFVPLIAFLVWCGVKLGEGE